MLRFGFLLLLVVSLARCEEEAMSALNLGEKNFKEEVRVINPGLIVFNKMPDTTFSNSSTSTDFF